MSIINKYLIMRARSFIGARAFLLVCAVFGSGFILAVSCGAATAAPRVADQEATTIRGTILLNGCQVTRQAVTLVAKPITVVGASDLRESKRIRSRTKVRQAKARFRISTLSREIPFTIGNVKKGTIYKLFIGLSPQVCGKVFWRGPADGLVTGGARDVGIEGFAARTEIELFNPSLDAWVGADHLDFTDDAAAVRQMRWRSTLPAVQSAELQLASEPFPTTGNFGACDEPEGGVLYRQELAATPGLAAGGWQAPTELDFRRLLPAPDRIGGGLSLNVYRQLTSGRPFYMRVVPLSAGR
ncbi:MAG: hypothetical protein DCC75_14265, partial [Proteobacteria bacterium]